MLSSCPRATRPVVPRRPTVPSSAAGRIVVADDDRLARELLAAILRNARATPSTRSTTGRRRCERVAQGGVDLRAARHRHAAPLGPRGVPPAQGHDARRLPPGRAGHREDRHREPRRGPAHRRRRLRLQALRGGGAARRAWRACCASSALHEQVDGAEGEVRAAQRPRRADGALQLPLPPHPPRRGVQARRALPRALRLPSSSTSTSSAPSTTWAAAPRATSPSAASPTASGAACATSTWSRATAAKSSWWCCRAPTSPARWWSPSASGARSAGGPSSPRGSGARSAGRRQRPALGRGRAQLTVSIGVALYPSRDVRTKDALLRAAEAALSQAKREGGNRICVFQQQGYIYSPTVGARAAPPRLPNAPRGLPAPQVAEDAPETAAASPRHDDDGRDGAGERRRLTLGGPSQGFAREDLARPRRRRRAHAAAGPGARASSTKGFEVLTAEGGAAAADLAARRAGRRRDAPRFR